jgi:hypothetical protein
MCFVGGEIFCDASCESPWGFILTRPLIRLQSFCPKSILWFSPVNAIFKLRRLQIGDWDPKDIAGRIGDSYMTAHVDPDHFTSSSLHELLRLFPMISHLRLAAFSTAFDGPGSSLDESFLALLHSGPPHDPCPLLTHMAILAPCAGFSDSAVLGFVRVQTSLATPLKQFRVDFGRGPEVNIVPDLQPFISNGLRVELKYRNDATDVHVWKFDPKHGLEQRMSLY